MDQDILTTDRMGHQDDDPYEGLSDEDREIFEEVFTDEFMAKLDRRCQAARN